MGDKTNGQHEPAIVTSVRCGPHEHYGVVTGLIMFQGRGDSGWMQGMGDIVLGRDADAPALPAWRRELAELFRVATYEEIAGRECFVLRSWPGFMGRIEGVEVDGRRWTLTGFVRRHFPGTVETPLEARVRTLRHNIGRAASDIQRWNREIEQVAEGYVDWESMP